MALLESASAFWWEKSHYAFSAYVLPGILVVSLLENTFALTVLILMRKGIGQRTRALFIALTVSDIFNLFVWYGLTLFADYGLRHLTGGTIYLSSVNQNVAFCKALRAIGFFTNHCSDWLYVLVNSERLLSVLTPHRAHNRRSKSCLLMPIGGVIFAGIFIAGFSAFMYSVKPSAALGGGISVVQRRIYSKYRYSAIRYCVKSTIY